MATIPFLCSDTPAQAASFRRRLGERRAAGLLFQGFDDPEDFRPAGTAVRTCAQRAADRLDAVVALRRRLLDPPPAPPEAGANQGPAPLALAGPPAGEEGG